jgi:hypothetical protein
VQVLYLAAQEEKAVVEAALERLLQAAAPFSLRALRQEQPPPAALVPIAWAVVRLGLNFPQQILTGASP